MGKVVYVVIFLEMVHQVSALEPPLFYRGGSFVHSITGNHVFGEVNDKSSGSTSYGGSIWAHNTIYYNDYNNELTIFIGYKIIFVTNNANIYHFYNWKGIKYP